MADDLSEAIAQGYKKRMMVILADGTTGLPYLAGSPAAGPTSFVKAEDAPSADGDAGSAVLAIRQATPIDTSSTDGDYEFLRIKDGRLWVRELAPTTTFRLASSAASNNAARAVNAPCTVFGIQARNTVVTGRYLVLYDSVLSPPVPGTTAIRKKLYLPPSQVSAYDFPAGLIFATGLGFALVPLAADADNTAVAAADIEQLNIDYV